MASAMERSPAGLGIGVEDLLSQSVRDGVGDSACVDEDPLVREGGQQTATVGDADRRVESDRLPNSVDVAFGNAVPPEDGSGQIGALDLETSLTCCVLTESQVMHHGGGEEQVLVVARVMQTALMVGQQAGEQKAPDAVIEDRLTLRGAGDRKTRIGERPGGEHEDLVHGRKRMDIARRSTVARGPFTAMIRP